MACTQRTEPQVGLRWSEEALLGASAILEASCGQRGNLRKDSGLPLPELNIFDVCGVEKLLWERKLLLKQLGKR